MSWMFYCTGFCTPSFFPDVSGFDTSNVTDMSYMFANTGAKVSTFSVDLSNFDTSKVTNMSWMFYCTGSNATTYSVNLSGFVTSNVTNMSGMFYYAGYNTSTFDVNLSAIDTSKVTEMSNMFGSAGYKATSFSVDLSGFNASNVTSMSSMFYSAGNNTAANNWRVIIPQKTGSLTNSTSVFYGKSSSYCAGPAANKTFTLASMLTTGTDFNAKLKKLVTANATYATEDSVITSILFDKNFTVPTDGRTIVDLSATGLIPVKAWRDGDTIKITSATEAIYANPDSSYMFYNFKGVSNKEFEIETDWFNTAHATNMSYMFSNAGYNASAFTLDLFDFNILNVTNVSNMFTDAGNTSTTEKWEVIIPYKTGSLTNTSSTFYANSNSVYAVPAADKEFTLVAKLVTGQNFNVKLKNLVTSNAYYYSSDTTITSILFDKDYTVPNDGRTVVDLSVSGSVPVYAWLYDDGKTIRITSSAETIYANPDSSDMFYSFYGVSNNEFTIEIDWFDTSKVTNMYCMFNCVGYNATTFSLDLTGFDTSNVTDMSSMFGFAGYNSSTFSLNLSNLSNPKLTSMSNMFSYAGYNATNYILNLSGFNTSNVTNMYSTFSGVGCNATTFTLDLSGFNTSNVTNMSWMFSGARSNAAAFSLDLSNFDTSNVTDMAGMFSSAGYNSSTFSLNLSNLSNPKLTNMSAMFNYAGFNAKTFTLNLSGFNTSNVTNMSNMFAGFGSNATTFTLDLSGFNTSKVTNMSSMFSYAGSNATSLILDLSSFDTSNVTDISYMFNYAGYKATSFSLDLSGFNTSKVTSMSNMFTGAGNASTAENWKVIIPYKTGSLKNAKSIYYGKTTSYSATPATGKAFSILSSLTNGKDFNAKLKSLVTPGATYLTGDSTITSILFDDSNTIPDGKTVVDLSTTGSIPVYAWLDDDGETIKITSDASLIYANSDSSYMFSNFNGVSNKGFTAETDWFDTSNITNMSDMFYNAGYNSTSFTLDLISFNTSNVTNMSSVFTGAGNASTAENWKVIIPKNTGSLTNTASVFYGKSESSYAEPAEGKEFAIVAKLATGKDFNTKLKILVNSSSNYSTSDSTIASILFNRNDTIPTDGRIVVDLSASGSVPIYAWLADDGKTVKITSTEEKIYANPDSSYMFCNFKGVSNAEFTVETDWFDTSNVTDMSSMFSSFASNSSVLTLDLTGFDTSNVTTMFYMFGNAGSNATTVNIVLPKGDNPKLTDTSSMFSYAGSNATTFSLDISKFDTSNVTNMSSMFGGLNENLLSLDFSNLDTSNVTNMSYMFSYAGYKATTFSLDLSDFDTSNVTNMSGMFSGVGSNSTSVFIDLSGFDTSNVTTMNSMFGNAGSNAASINIVLPKCKNPKLTDTSFMFSYAGYNSTSFSIDLSDFDTSNVTNMSYMFAGIGSNASSIDVDFSNLDTSNVTDMSGMFSSVGNKLNTLSLDLSDFDTSNVTTMNYMFGNTGYSATSINIVLPSCDNPKLTNTSSMFSYAGYNSVSFSIDLSNFDTSNVTNVSYMFSGAGNSAAADNWKVFIPYKTGSLANTTTKFYANSESVYAEPTTDKAFTIARTLATGKEFNARLKSLVKTDATYNTEDSTITSILFDKNYVVPTDGRTVVDLSASGSIAVYAWLDDDEKTIKITSSEEIIYANSDSSYMFYNFKGTSNNDLTIDLSWFSTANVTNMKYMFAGSERLASLDLSGFDTSKVTSMSHMFDYARGLKSLDLSKFDTFKVTNMSYMFYFCNNLTVLDLSDFNTENVTDMSAMFKNCTSLNTLDVSNFNTSKVTDMSAMFNECSAIKSIDISVFDTSKVTDMSCMFKGVSNLAVLDISNFNTVLVTDMSSMFENMYKLTSIKVDEETWNTASVTSSENMFTNDKQLKGQNGTTYSASNTDKTYAVVDKAGTPGYLTGSSTPVLTDNIYWAATQSNKLYISDADLSSITDETVKESGHFAPDTKSPGWYSYSGKSSITDVIVNAGISPEYMSGWFENFKALTTITNISNINTVNTLSMNNLFDGCSSLTAINLTSFNTSKVTDMSYMFNGCTGLTELDLSNFNTYNVKKMSYMFASCTDLTTIKVTGLWGVTSVINSTSMFEGDTSLKGMNNTVYDAGHTDKEYARIDEGEDNPGYLSEDTVSYTIAFNGNNGLGSMDPVNASVGVELKLPANTFTKTNYVFDGWNTKADGTGTDYLDQELVVDLATEADEVVTLYAKWKQEDKIYWAATSDNGTLYIASRTIITSDLIDGDSSIADSGSFTTNTALKYSSGGWRNKTGITKIVFVDKVSPESTAYWFASFGSLASVVNIDNLDTSNVTDMTFMFNNCLSLAALDVSGFDTSNATNVSYMFYNCKLLSTLDVSGFDTSNVTDMTYMFGGCESLTAIDLSGFDTSKVTATNNMFSGCLELETLDLSGFDTRNVTDMNCMFTSCSSLTTLDLSNFNTSKVTSMQSMFASCSNLVSIDLSGFDTAKVTDMLNMFGSCSKLIILDLTSFNTKSVTTMANMFGGCSALTTIKVIDGKWNTNAVVSSSYMFSGCTSLKGGNDTAWTSTNPTDKTYAVVDKPGQAGYLTASKYYTVTYNANKGTSPESALIDKVAVDANYKLLTNTFDPINDNYVFAGWNTQSDGKGTYYPENAVVKNLASADGSITLYAQWKEDPIIYWNYKLKSLSERVLNISSTSLGGAVSGSFRSSEEPGWIAAKLLLANKVNFVSEIRPVSTSGWFENCLVLSSIENITNLNTVNVSDMSYMFKNCKRLVTLDLSNFNTVGVTDMSNMFNDCERLKLINLSGFNTANVTNTGKMFAYCDELVTITTDKNWDLSKVTSSTNMFKGDANLIGSNGTRYDASKTDKTSAVIDKDGTPGYFSDESIPMIYWQLSGSKNKTLSVTSDATKVDTDTYKPFSAAQVPNWTAYDLSKVTTVEFLDNVTTFQVQGWFNSVTSVKTITHLEYLNTSKVFDMSGMFNGCSKLTSLDLSGFNTTKVTDMSDMFKNCSGITVLDISTFDTSKVTDMSGMFNGCSNLSIIDYPTASGDFKGFDTSKVTDMSYMFNKCYSIKSLNLYNYNTSNVTDMSYMFNGCTSLKLVDLSDQSSENRSKFDVSKVTNMADMFNNCSSLKTIVVSTWSLNENLTSSDMFTGCTSIVGEQGQTYDPSHTDKTYARVDNLTERGYLCSTYNRFRIGSTEYSNLSAALTACKADDIIVMINDSNESLTSFIVNKNITLDLNGNNLIVKSLNVVESDKDNCHPLIIDTADDEEKGSLSFTLNKGFVYKKELAKTESTDTSVRYIPVCISNNTYQFNEVLVGTANKTTSSQYWREGDQAFVGSYLRNDLDVPTILADGSGINLGIKITHGKTDKELVFERETIDEYIEKYTHAKPYFHIKGIEEDSITVNGYVTQKNGSIDYRFDGISRDITLVK